MTEGRYDGNERINVHIALVICPSQKERHGRDGSSHTDTREHASSAQCKELFDRVERQQHEPDAEPHGN